MGKRFGAALSAKVTSLSVIAVVAVTSLAPAIARADELPPPPPVTASDATSAQPDVADPPGVDGSGEVAEPPSETTPPTPEPTPGVSPEPQPEPTPSEVAETPEEQGTDVGAGAPSPVAPSKEPASAAPPSASREAAAAPVIAAVTPSPPAAASDTALIAWVGATEPATKITLQAALNAVPDGGTVGVVPGSYKFNSLLTVARSTSIVASGATILYGRFTVNAGGLSTTGLTLSPAANSQVVVTVPNAAVGVVLTDLVIANSTSDGTTSFTRTTGIGFTGSADTQVRGTTITDVDTALALAGSSGARIEGIAVSAVATGASITAANANPGPTFVGGSMNVTGNAVALGSTSAPSVTGMTLTGSGTGTAMNVNLATAANVASTTADGFVNGVLVAATNTGAGPILEGSSFGASLTGVDLGATSGAQLSDVDVLRTGPGTAASNSTGVNLRRSSGVQVSGSDVSGFARGIHADDVNAAMGPVIDGGTVTARTIGISLGATESPSVTGTQVQGQGATGITDGIRVLMASDADIADATVTGFTRGIYVDGLNTGAGPEITGSTISVVNVKAFGITLGSTTGATVTDVDVSGTNELPQTGITVARAPGAVVTDARVSNVTVGIGATRVAPELNLPPIAGPQIIRPIVTDSGSGIQLASSVDALIEDARVDVQGDGINGWETEDARITSPHITGVPGPGPTDGTNAIRFYTSRGVFVSDALLVGGATGLYWDMTYDVVVENADISGMEWYASYTEGVTGYELRDSEVHDNAAIANLTINPSDVPVNNLRQVSSSIDWHDNTFTNNPAGIYLPQGVEDFAFENNTVTGSDRFVILATPVHGFLVEDNAIQFGPATPTAAAISVTTFWEDLDEPGSYSSSDLSVTRNQFTGAGPFIRVGAVESVPDATPVSIELAAAEPPDASAPSPEVPQPPEEPEGAAAAAVVPLQVPADRRALRTTMNVTENTFPQDSTAIVTLPNAETGEDTNTENDMIDGVVAVDAREEGLSGQNDWGSACGPRVAATGYDGGGAFITEGLTTQVLYPELCVSSVTVVASTVCRDNVGYLEYDVTLEGVAADPAPVVAVIWWGPDVYPTRDDSIPAADEQAIIDDGADAVQYLSVPTDWQEGDPLTGETPVPDAVVDDAGQATRDTWTLEVRVNPVVASAAITFDPPADLAACPPDPEPIDAPDLTVDVVAPTCTTDGTLTFLGNPPAENANGYEFPGEGYRVYLSPAYDGPGTYTATAQGIEPGFDPAFPNGTVIEGGATTQTLTVLAATGFQNTDPGAPCYRPIEVTPPVPVYAPGTCAAPESTIQVPAATTGVVGYRTPDGSDVTGTTITLQPGQSATVSVVLETGYRLAAGASSTWSFRAGEPECATPVPPTDEAATCADTRTLVRIPADPGPGVEGYADRATGDRLSGTIYLIAGESITVDAVLATGVELSPGAASSWTYEYSGGCPDPGPITGGGSIAGGTDPLATTGPGPISGLVALSAGLLAIGLASLAAARRARRITI